MNIKKQTKTPRSFEPSQCVSCGTDYAAPVKIRGQGIIGGGKCPDCLRLERPATEKRCPVCKKMFKTQAGHVRETCSRDCQKIHTLLKKAPESVAVANYAQRQAGIVQAQAEAEERERALTAQAEQAKADAAKAEAEAEAARLEALRQQEQAEAEEAYRNASGTQLERLAEVSKTVRNRRRNTAGNITTAANAEPVAA